MVDVYIILTYFNWEMSNKLIGYLPTKTQAHLMNERVRHFGTTTQKTNTSNEVLVD